MTPLSSSRPPRDATDTSSSGDWLTASSPSSSSFPVTTLSKFCSLGFGKGVASTQPFSHEDRGEERHYLRHEWKGFDGPRPTKVKSSSDHHLQGRTVPELRRRRLLTPLCLQAVLNALGHIFVDNLFAGSGICSVAMSHISLRFGNKLVTFTSSGGSFIISSTSICPSSDCDILQLPTGEKAEETDEEFDVVVIEHDTGLSRPNTRPRARPPPLERLPKEETPLVAQNRPVGVRSALRSSRRIQFVINIDNDVEHKPKAPRDIEGNISDSNIVSGRRNRKPTAPNTQTHTYKLAVAEDDEEQFAAQEDENDGIRDSDVCLFTRVLRKPEKQLRLMPQVVEARKKEIQWLYDAKCLQLPTWQDAERDQGEGNSFPPRLAYDSRSLPRIVLLRTDDMLAFCIKEEQCALLIGRLKEAQFRFSDKGDVKVFCGVQFQSYGLVRFVSKADQKPLRSGRWPDSSIGFAGRQPGKFTLLFVILVMLPSQQVPSFLFSVYLRAHMKFAKNATASVYAGFILSPEGVLKIFGENSAKDRLVGWISKVIDDYRQFDYVLEGANLRAISLNSQVPLEERIP
eukprot:g12516.t1